MIEEQQQKFYGAVGRALQSALKRRNISVTKLTVLSGEQHKTIKGIMAGRPCSLHHAVWMKNVLGIDLNEIIRDMEGKSGKEISWSDGHQKYNLGDEYLKEVNIDDFI